MVHGPSGKISIAEIAFAANARQDHLPTGMDPLLDVTATYEPTESGGVFALDINRTCVRGQFVVVEPPHRVVFTWGVDGSDALPPGT